MKEIMKRILACCMALSVYGNLGVFAQETETPEETEGSENQENTAYVKDECELLTQAETEELDAYASEVADKYNCGVYVRVFNDMGSYTDIESFAESVYTEESLGLGEGQNGVMLILIISGKDYDIFVYGDEASAVFTDDAKNQMADAVVSDITNDDFYNAFKAFIDIAEEDLEAKANEEPEQPDSPYLAEYDVTEYGVNGTDTEDDNALINNLLHEASLLDNPENKPILIHFPEGIYYLNNPLFVFSNMILQLDDNAVIKRSDISVNMLRGVHNNEDGRICDGENCTHGDYTKIHDVTIEGGTWDGNTNSNTAVSYNTLFSFDHGSDIKIQNTNITNASAIHFIVFDGIKNALVDNVTLTNQYLFTGDDDFYDTVYENGVAEKISPKGNYNCYLLACGREAVHIDYTDSDGSASYPLDHTPCQNITVQNCTFDNVLSGAGNHHFTTTEPKQTGIVIKENYFKNVKGIVMDLYDMPDFQVLDNFIEDSMLYSAQQYSKGVFKNNVINGAYRYCYLANGEMSSDNESVVIKDPYNFKESTILLINGKADITKMNIQLPDGWNGKDFAVPVRNYSVLNMSDSKITGATVGAVYSGNYGKINLDKVTITGVNKNAQIAFGTNGSGSVKNCTISKTKDAIDVWSGSSNVTISGNTISQCENAIGVYSAGKNISITNNKISGPTVSGIHVDSTGVNVTGNTLTNIPKTINGIVLSSVTSSSTVMNNTVEGGKYG
ncbi:MAG: TPM domain-containing protein, partial [Solobacterium sp.]|nr:TPM domain-containing protein [Solobacterium sp.]